MAGAEPLRVVVAGGGTGGHLYPGIAVAREIRRRDPGALVTFAGTAQGLEARVLPREGFELDVIRSGGFKGKSLGTRARNLALLILGAAGARGILRRRSPDVVIGLGGYSSGPVVLLAALRGIPTLLMEQNAVPGLTNRLLARVVSAAAVAFDQTTAHFGGKAFVAELVGASIGLMLTHQTGERDIDMVREGYRRAGQAARVEPFLFAMAREMTAADLIVCRAGATTVAEITAIGRPAILIPLPTATDDHQRKNAEVIAQAGAAEVIEQRDLTGSRLAGRIIALARDPERRRLMAEAARRLAKPDAAGRIVDRVLTLAGR
jgi:UDP-N-acetylglucosamine--N-acetylmuramyl-(pentapeptide) pyrophosphoryl-undecaprenol N-acetylglucosamine transferase